MNIRDSRRETLKPTLDGLYLSFNQPDSATDPIQIVRRFTANDDREVVAFIAAGLAFGRVSSVMQSIERVMVVMGDSPARFVRDFTPARDGGPFAHLEAAPMTGAAPAATPIPANPAWHPNALGAAAPPAAADQLANSPDAIAVVPGSPAAKLGFKKDDLVMQLNGEVIKDIRDYERILATLQPGVEVTIVVKRKRDVLTYQISPSGE